MKFELYHNGFRLIQCKTLEAALMKARVYRDWFSGVDIRKVS